MPIVPTITLDAAHDTGSRDFITSDPTLTLSAFDATTTTRIVEIRGANGTVLSSGPTYTTPALSASYTVFVFDTDIVSGQTEQASVTFTLDRDAPATPSLNLVRDSSNGHLITNSAVLVAVGLEAGAKAQYLIVSGPSGTTNLGWTDTPTLTLDGHYQVAVKQIDIAGNESPASAYFEFTLDTSAPGKPVVTLSHDPDGNLLITEDGFTVTGGESGDNVEYRLDTGTWTSTAPDHLGNGSYTIEVRLTDIAGNHSDISEQLGFTVDKPLPSGPNDPVITNDSGADRGDGITNELPTFAALPNGAHLQFQLSGATAWFDALSAADFATDGQYTVTVRVIDVNDNASTDTSVVQFTLDRSVARIMATLTNGTMSNGVTTVEGTPDFTFEHTELGAATEFTSDGNTWRDIGELSNLGAGHHTLTFRQTDIAGNVSAGSDSVGFTVHAAPSPDTGITNNSDVSRDGHEGAGAGLGGGDFGFM